MPEVWNPRKLGTLTFEAGARKSLEIDRDGVLVQINARFRFTITNGGSAAVAPLFQTLATLIKRIEINVAGRDTTMSISGPEVAARAHYEFGSVQKGMGDTVVLTGSAVTAYDVVLPIPFYLPRGVNVEDTALDLRRIGQATIAVTFGSIGDFYGTPNAAAISLTTLEFEAEYIKDVPDDRIFLVRSFDQIEENMPATTSNFSIPIDKGTGVFLRTLMVQSLADGVGVNTIINSMRLEAGDLVFANRDGASVQADNMRRFNQASAIPGVYYLTTVPFGKGTRMINTGGLKSDLRLVLDTTKVSGVNTIKVSREIVRTLKLS